MAEETWFHGVAASPGIALAAARPLESGDLEVEERSIAAGEVAAEVARFETAVDDARDEIRQLRQTTAEMLGEEQARIFDAHLSILSDPTGYDETIHDIMVEKKNAEYLYRRNLARVADQLEAHGGPYFAERAQDIRDVKRRVVRRLLGLAAQRTPASTLPGILVARDVAPSEAAVLDPTRVVGLAVDRGSRTSHAAIMARSRGIPAVVGLKNMSAEVKDGDMIVLDGFRGRVIVNPRPETMSHYRQRQARHRAAEERWSALANLPAVTLDGRSLILAANVEMPEEVDQVIRRGAAGIGLFRTEFFLMRNHRFPPEAEQFQAYRSVVEKVAPHPVIIRTLDVGGDKFASYLGAGVEDNPFLGMRGIRFLTDHKDLFHSQIRAAYRASAYGKVKILFPMVSAMEEFRAARDLCHEVRAELEQERIAFDRTLELGVMVEVPSTVILSDLLAREADFFSIGSNDLIQYTLAVDRGSARVAHLYEPFHPAVLRSIRRTVESAHAEGRWVGICGEMAGDPAALVLLIGFGVDEISVGTYLLPEAKRVIREIRYSEARGWAEKAAGMASATEVKEFITPIMQRLFHDLMEPAANGPGPGGGES